MKRAALLALSLLACERQIPVDPGPAPTPTVDTGKPLASMRTAEHVTRCLTLGFHAPEEGRCGGRRIPIRVVDHVPPIEGDNWLDRLNVGLTPAFEAERVDCHPWHTLFDGRRALVVARCAGSGVAHDVGFVAAVDDKGHVEGVRAYFDQRAAGATKAPTETKPIVVGTPGTEVPRLAKTWLTKRGDVFVSGWQVEPYVIAEVRERAKGSGETGVLMVLEPRGSDWGIKHRFANFYRGRIEAGTLPPPPPREGAEGVLKAGAVVVHEGLPHQRFERDLLRRERKRHEAVDFAGFPFYAPARATTPADAATLTALLTDASSLRPFGGEKRCGGFHPDYAVSWTRGEQTWRALLCFGCGEVVWVPPGGKTQRYDMTESVRMSLRTLLGKGRYAVLRPQSAKAPAMAVLEKRVKGRRYRVFDPDSAVWDLTLTRPSHTSHAVRLSVAGTYTSPHGDVEGTVVHGGRVVAHRPKSWEGVTQIVDGRLTVKRASGRVLSAGALRSLASSGGSLIQGHLLVEAATPRPLKSSPALHRRAVVTRKQGTSFLVDSLDPVELATFASDLVALGAHTAMNLDMGSWDEGWYRDPRTQEKIRLGVNRSATAKQTNWIVLRQNH